MCPKEERSNWCLVGFVALQQPLCVERCTVMFRLRVRVYVRVCVCAVSSGSRMAAPAARRHSTYTQSGDSASTGKPTTVASLTPTVITVPASTPYATSGTSAIGTARRGTMAAPVQRHHKPDSAGAWRSVVCVCESVLCFACVVGCFPSRGRPTVCLDCVCAGCGL